MTAPARPRRAILLPGVNDQEIQAKDRVEIGRFAVHPNGLAVPPGPFTFEDWEPVGLHLATMTRGLQFAVGDWLNIGEDKLGEVAAQAIDHAHWSEATVRVYRWVASQVPAQNRFMDRGLEFAHHQLVAKLPPRDQKKWLTRALGTEADGVWSVARLRSALREGEDRPIVAFYLLVNCADEKARLKLKNELEGRGLQCKDVDKRRSSREQEEDA